MQNIYTSSIISLRTRTYLSFSSNDYSNTFNERCPSCFCGCCCSFPISSSWLLPLNPSILYGLRQSTLIQWSPSRRLIFGSGERHCLLPSIYDVSRSSCEESCCIKDKSDTKIWGKGKCSKNISRVLEEKLGRCRSGAVGVAEAIISLLTEDVGEVCLDVRERKVSSFKHGKVARRENALRERRKARKDGVASVKSDSKLRLESVNVQSREGIHKMREEREVFLKCEEQRLRQGGSSSSYYSLTDSGDLESDEEVETKHEEFRGEPSTGIGKDSRSAGVVIIREVKEESEKNRDEKPQPFEGNGHIDRKVQSLAGWDWRKRSEKKLTEVSNQEATSTKDSIRRQPKPSGAHECCPAKASIPNEQLIYEQDELISDVNLHRESTSHFTQTDCQISGHSTSSLKYKNSTETNDYDAKTSSSSGRILKSREENSIVGEYCKACNHVSIEDELRSSSQQHGELSEMHGTNSRHTSTVDRLPAISIKKQNENSTLLQTSAKQANEQHQRTNYVATGQVNLWRKSHKYSETACSDSNYVSNSSSQHQSETGMKNLAENSNLLTSHQELKGQEYKVAGKVISQSESRKASDFISTSVFQSGAMETVINPQRPSEPMMYYEENDCTSQVQSVEQPMEKCDRVNPQTALSNDLRSPIKQASSHGITIGNPTIISSSVGLTSQTIVQQICGEEDEQISHIPMIHPPTHLLEGASSYVGPVSGFARQDSSRASEAGTSSLYIDPQSGTQSHDEASGSGRNDPSQLFFREDALGSAERFEKSSNQIVNDFFEKIRHEASTSEIQMEKTLSEKGWAQEGKDHVQELMQPDFEHARIKKQDSRRSSHGYGTKGPSVEIWDERAPAVQDLPEIEASEDTTTPENALVRRTGRSLWSIIADVFRLKWVLHAETHKPTTKSGGQSSSNESVSTEAWFSGHEPDETNKGNMKRDKTSMLQEPISADEPLLKGTPPQSQREGFGEVSSKDKVKHVKADTSLSLGVLKIKSGFGGSSSEASFDWNFDQRNPKSTTPSDFPLLAARQTGSHGLEDISEGGRSELVGGATGEQMKHNAHLIQTGLSASERNDEKLKRRKLQRRDQVLKEGFDIWEEAYRYDSEQRKIDEMFMQEALLEAKKAADTWEVPVGAVLVHNGEIIARGYNLVEELRDSTAHAEMMCIREASNILRTWRLSETTLYVTLEPCPMCAGAILQARIDTLVWGAPNKLLGADGSWIKLFQDGGEGESGLDSTSKPAAPVHPFHPKMTIRRRVLEAECADVMQQFFQLRRKKEKKTEPPRKPPCLPVPHHPFKLLHKMHDFFHLMFCL
ncbi:hypothetical protein Nepgr_033054 [Nepenthes gracilis]|uniref:tRNA(adenine(34)) deaminase n=1 Tax=Nepenthes gracilis TaxID=150966 RepID=A0AAD3TLB2_NEPGR|nr:hypothetical protein Nepgr_033054 [Nepenthes gracilis]